MTSYLETLIWTIVKSSFSKKSFCYLLMSLMTILIRMHIDSLISYILITNYEFINFCIHIIVSTILIINSKYIYDIVHRYEPEFYNIIRFLINNYNERNFKKWKRNITITLCIYFYTMTFIIDITNNLIRQIIIEYIICYFVIETYEKYTSGRLNIINNKEYDCSNKDSDIINDLIKNNNNETNFINIKNNN